MATRSRESRGGTVLGSRPTVAGRLVILGLAWSSFVSDVPVTEAAIEMLVLEQHELVVGDESRLGDDGRFVLSGIDYWSRDTGRVIAGWAHLDQCPSPAWWPGGYNMRVRSVLPAAGVPRLVGLADMLFLSPRCGSSHFLRGNPYQGFPVPWQMTPMVERDWTNFPLVDVSSDGDLAAVSEVVFDGSWNVVATVPKEDYFGSPVGEITELSGDGRVAVVYYYKPFGRSILWLWPENRIVEPDAESFGRNILGEDYEYSSWRAADLSNDGSVFVGGIGVCARSGECRGRAVRWTPAGFELLNESLPFEFRETDIDVWEKATAISDNGCRAVGSLSINRLKNAFIWSSNETPKLKTLNYWLDRTLGFDTGGIQIVEAHDVSADGRVILATGLRHDFGNKYDEVTVLLSGLPPIEDDCQALEDLRTASHFISSGEDGDPVNTFTGELLLHEAADLDLGGSPRLAFRRYYASGLERSPGAEAALGASPTGSAA